MQDSIKCLNLAHAHIIVDDLDYAAGFYREVMSFLEFQSHESISNAGLARYYGWTGAVDDFRVSLRFLAWPEVLTIKLVKVRIRAVYEGLQTQATLSPFEPRFNSGMYQYLTGGLGPLSLRVEDLEATFKYLSAYAQDYSSKYKISIVSAPTFLSPLKPGEVGATKDSVLYKQDDILNEIAKSWPQRQKFQMIDPFGVRWEFNNDVI